MSTFVDGADVRRPAEAQNSAAPPSVAPDPADDPDHCDKKTDSGSLWLQDEIARRIAAKKNAGTGGRHARRDNPDPSAAAGYVPRHSTATPGPAAAPPAPVGPPPPRKLPRRGPAGANGDTEAWTGPDRSARDRPVLGGPSLPAGLPVQPPASGRAGAPPRPSGAAAARLLSAPVPQASPPASPPAPLHVTQPGRSAPPPHAAAPTGAWPVAPARPLTPPGGTPAPGGPPPRGLDPGPLTAPVLDGPVVDEPLDDEDDFVLDDGSGTHDEILWSVDDMPPVDTTPPDAIAVPEQRAAEGPRGARFPRLDDADAESPKRVRVVLAERKGVARPVRTVVDIQEATAVGALLRSNLIGSQLTVALRFAAGAGLTLGILPLLFALFPAIGEFGVLGLRLPWLLLGVLVYPFLLGLGWWHTRTAERVEQNFADHVQE